MPQSSLGLDAEDIVLTETIQKEISDFLTKKRKGIIYALDENKKLSQKELADEVKSSVASLSNILIKFEQFKHVLIDSKASGKYRYYYLTELGKAYVEKNREDEKSVESEKIIQHEVIRRLQDAKNKLKEFQTIYEDDWEIKFDDFMIERYKFSEITKEDGEILVDKFLENVEKLMLYNDESLINNIMKILSSNTILQGRLAQIIDRFTPFCFLLSALEEDENTLQIYKFLEEVIENNMESAENSAENLGWTDQYQKLSAALSEIMDHVKDGSIKDVYGCFCRYLAGDKSLSAFLARIADKEVKKMA